MPGRTRDVRECPECKAWWSDLPVGIGDAAYYRAKPRIDHEVLESGVQRFEIVRDSIIRALGHEPRSLLDVGAAQGAHLAVYGPSVHKAAVEPAESAVAALRRRGIDWLGPTIETLPVQSQFEAVTCCDVIEHVENPRQLLERLAAAVALNGVLVIVTGDTHSLPARISGRRWQYVALPEHRAAFNWDSLRPILEGTLGLRVVDRGTIANEDVTVRYVVRFAIGVAREAIFRVTPATVLDRLEREGRTLFPFFFDNMIVIAQKVRAP